MCYSISEEVILLFKGTDSAINHKLLNINLNVLYASGL